MKEKEESNNMDLMLKKVEIGCGKTKTEGYIGMDRFQLPGVDIVADLNDTFPIEDNSVDVVYACHSLEHLDSMEKTMSEIYRICKHKAIVQILAPYYYATLNTANFYHVNVFNEDTFRFFTTFPDTGVIDKEEWYSPHSSYWGLSDSDNSNSDVQMELLNMEFFYYKEYVKLADEQKRRARRSFNNVCDQIYYELIINKSGVPFTPEEIQLAREYAKKIEPPLIQHIRNRDAYQEASESLFDDFTQIAVNQIEQSEERLIRVQGNKIELAKTQLIQLQDDKIELAKIQLMQLQDDKIELAKTQLMQLQDDKIELAKTQLKQLQNDKIQLIEKQFEQQVKEIVNSNKKENQALKKRVLQNFDAIEREINKNFNRVDEIDNLLSDCFNTLKNENQILKTRLEYAEVINFEIYNSIYKEKSFRNKLFNRKEDMYELLRETHTQFLDELIFNSNQFNKKSVLNFSPPIPWHTYREYMVQGAGERIGFFLIGSRGAQVLVEAVINNQIVKQEYITISHDGVYNFDIGSFSGAVYIRFRITNNRDIIRVLEINNRKVHFLKTKCLAAVLG